MVELVEANPVRSVSTPTVMVLLPPELDEPPPWLVELALEVGEVLEGFEELPQPAPTMSITAPAATAAITFLLMSRPPFKVGGSLPHGGSH